MARIQGIEAEQAPFFVRQVMKKVRKMLGKVVTPMKIQARVPRVFWMNIAMEWLLGKTKLPVRWRYIVNVRTAARVGCPF